MQPAVKGSGPIAARETPAAVRPVWAAPAVSLRVRLRRLAEVVLLCAVDWAALAASLHLGVYAWQAAAALLPYAAFKGPPPDMVARLWWFPWLGVACLAYEGLYTRRLPFWRELERLVKAAVLVLLLALAFVFAGKGSEHLSRGAVLLAGFWSTVLLPLARYAGKRVLARLSIWQRRVLILGAAKTGQIVAEMAQDPFLGYRVVGFLDDDPAKQGREVAAGGRVFGYVLGTFADAPTVMARTGARTLILAAPGLAGREVVRLVGRLQRLAENVLVIPDLFGLPLMGLEAEYYFSRQILALRIRNNLASPFNRAVKRLLDLVLGALFLALCLLPMALVALAVKLDSPGPVLFVQRRLGLGGRPFGCYKFRTMVVDAEERLKRLLAADPRLAAEWRAGFKLENDPRVTRVGRILRRWSLDELPQLFNVLKGEMSLVGPRPRPLYEGERAGADELFLRGLLVRPGLTGLWQVSGRSDIDFQGRLALDAWYVSNWSVWLDVIILLRTVRAVLRRTGAR